MKKSENILTVKDTSFVMIIIVAFCIFPIIFFLLVTSLNDNFIISIVITFLIYSIFGIFFVNQLKRYDEVYVLTATADSVTIRKHGTFHLEDITLIETFSEIPLGRRSPRKYIRFVFSGADDIILDASNYDIDYNELKKKLLAIKNKKTKELSSITAET